MNILSVADAAFERKTGFELDYRKVKTLQLTQLDKPLKQRAEAEKEFPKLAAKFGNYEERWEKVIDIMVNPRKELLQQLEESGKQRHYVIAGIDTNNVIYDESGWTVKDLIAHITAWEEEAIRSLQAFYNGRVYTIDKDDHTYNHEQQVKRKDLTIVEVFSAWDAVRQEFIAAVTAIPDEKFDQLMTLPWGEQNTPAHLVREMLKHEADHIQEITNKK